MWSVIERIDDIAQVDTLTVDNSVAVTSPIPLIRYQYRDHLGSATLETNETGQVISYEDERTIFAAQNEGLADLQVREPQSRCILLGLLLIGQLGLVLICLSSVIVLRIMNDCSFVEQKSMSSRH